MSRLLLFGATGAIGSCIANHFGRKGWSVSPITRNQHAEAPMQSWNPLDPSDTNWKAAIRKQAPFNAVCWAQGANLNDSIYNFEIATHEALYQSNVLFILQSLHLLLQEDVLAKPARLCVISSIWQNLARQNKLSYCVTKSALRGLVLSAATDLAADGHLINAVLPGVLETPMTRANLSTKQIERIESSTKFGRLPTLDDVASAVYNLCSPHNTGTTGQFITVDLGFSNARII